MNKLPALFQAIIAHDQSKPQGDVLPIHAYTAWLSRRRELSKAAEAYVSRQRGGGSTRAA
ncbi:hypothetical protein [Rhizobium sp. BK376]|uniref:hypothetical protein n=1 Tax=Rhizobium sp. BK376 TaxID=2512149 RepID=UPI0010538FB6|nr:hypothetical protein [Rhizobium sp. BK376]TCR85516.1 hypothetical protein EV561_107294 [Rhizobium sp. BK376]